MSSNNDNVPEPMRWIKSSYSGNEGGDCVEITTQAGLVHIRDSKDRSGPMLSFSPDSWSVFITYVKSLPRKGSA